MPLLTVHSKCMCLSGLQLVVWRSKVFPASAHARRDGAVETGPGEWSLLQVLRVPGGASCPRSWREDHTEWRQVLDRGGVPRDRRCDVQLCQRRLEPRLHARHPLPAERILPPQLSSGRKCHVHLFKGSCWPGASGLTLFMSPERFGEHNQLESLSKLFTWVCRVVFLHLIHISPNLFAKKLQ